MGLDMHLYAEKYVSGYDFSSDEDKEMFKDICKTIGADEFRDKETPSLTVKLTVGYWRKANAIHGWFVKNIQQNEDDCGDYYISREELEILRTTCKDVLNDTSKAGELLPPNAGFFFGSQDIDEWYLSDLQHTIDIIDKLEKSMPKDWQVIYHSSW